MMLPSDPQWTKNVENSPSQAIDWPKKSGKLQFLHQYCSYNHEEALCSLSSHALDALLGSARGFTEFYFQNHIHMNMTTAIQRQRQEQKSSHNIYQIQNKVTKEK